jgi:hypothetical protein
MVIKDGTGSLGGTGPAWYSWSINDSGDGIPKSLPDALDAELPLHKKSL